MNKRVPIQLSGADRTYLSCTHSRRDPTLHYTTSNPHWYIVLSKLFIRTSSVSQRSEPCWLYCLSWMQPVILLQCLHPGDDRFLLALFNLKESRAGGQGRIQSILTRTVGDISLVPLKPAVQHRVIKTLVEDCHDMASEASNYRLFSSHKRSAAVSMR